MGCYLSKPNTVKLSQFGHASNLKYGLSAMQGWRMEMEDSHIALPNFVNGISLFGVFDGHGGPEVSKFCSEHFSTYLKEDKEFIAGNYKAALENNFLKMDELLRANDERSKHSKNIGELHKSSLQVGCTANVLLLANDTAYVANAGDARAVLYNNAHEVIPLSFDHKPEVEIEEKRIYNAGGFIRDGRVNGNLNLTRAIGDLQFKKDSNLKPEEQIISAFPDVMERKITKDDKYMLIGCDGIWETMIANDMFQLIEKKIKSDPNINLSQVVEELLDNLIAKDTVDERGCDNMSAILIEFLHK